MEPIVAIIPARSERQAMDWSLVLASQGIEVTIDRAAEDHGWQLLVAPPDHERALQAIRQYRVENRASSWRQELPWTGLVFDARSIVWFLVLIGLFSLSEARYDSLSMAGMMDNKAVASGEWWRLFTATMLHKDLSHLTANVTAGVLLLGLAMGSFGSGFGLLAAYLAGVGGNLAGLLLYPDTHRGLGASGLVMGAIGLLAASSVPLLRAGGAARQLVTRGLLGGFLLLVFFGVNPNSDVIAHAGGFVSGCLLGGVLALLPSRWKESRWANRLADLACAGLVLLTWWLALARTLK